MLNVKLPKQCSHINLLKRLNDSGLLTDAWESLNIELPSQCFVESSSLAFLCTWGVQQLQRNRKITFSGDQSALSYLSRMNLFQHLEFSFNEGFNRHPEAGRFTTLCLIENNSESVFKTTNSICDLIIRQVDNAREIITAFEWAVNEVIDNVRVHSQTEVPGSVCAQYYPTKSRIDISICDLGRGIKASLEESRLVNSHQEAIFLALQRGVTRDSQECQGNGLAGTLEIVKSNTGELYIWTGNTNYCFSKESKEEIIALPSIDGTGILLKLNTDRPVDLRKTWLASIEENWNYLNTECERISDKGSVDIATECVHTGGREPAKSLRRKIQAILPEYEEPLVLNFDGITSASSSFLDELLGRLVEELDSDKFYEKIRLVNLSALLSDMANVVIHQRMQNNSATNCLEIRVDYSKLQEYLEVGDWENADQETFNILMAISDPQEERLVSCIQPQRVPYEVLSNIDQIWTQYSKGHFGFSVQRDIWIELESVGSIGSDNMQITSWLRFCECVGWHGTWDSIIRNLDAPKGHLPAIVCWLEMDQGPARFEAIYLEIFSKIEKI